MKLRKLIFWVHLTVGCLAGIVILVMSVTGVLLAYERQINAWADRSGVHIAPAGEPLPPETLLTRIFAAEQAVPVTLTLRSEPSSPAEASFGREKTLLVDPYTGAMLGPASRRSRDFFEAVERLHRAVGLQGGNRALGRSVTGAANFLFLGLVLSGPFLWLPKTWIWSRVKPTLFFRGNVSGKAREWNWHNVIGIWTAIPLLVIVVSGVIMSYPWANDFLYRLAGSPVPSNQRPPERGRGGRLLNSNPDFSGLNDLWSQAQRQIPRWQSITLRLPASAREPAVFNLDEGNGGQPQSRSTVTFDRKSGEMRLENFASNNLGRRLRMLARFAHTGEAGGAAGQLIATLASLGAALLVYTGISLAMRRWFRARARAREAVSAGELQLR